MYLNLKNARHVLFDYFRSHIVKIIINVPNYCLKPLVCKVSGRFLSDLLTPVHLYV